MANPYPPTPSFGGGYTAYPFSDAGLRDGGFRTLPAEGPPAPQYKGSNTAPTSTNPTPAMNNRSFQTNAAISNVAHAVPPPILPPPFHVSPELFKQFANSTLPPPPYPPVPIPPLGFPQFPPSTPHFAASSTPPNNHLTSNSLSHQKPPPPLHSLHSAPAHQQDSFIVSREEGELSDGELNETSSESIVEASRTSGLGQIVSSVMPLENNSNQETVLASTSSTSCQPVNNRH